MIKILFSTLLGHQPKAEDEFLEDEIRFGDVSPADAPATHRPCCHLRACRHPLRRPQCRSCPEIQC